MTAHTPRNTSRNQIQQLLADTQDPSDFPEHSRAPGLRSLDFTLRCTICSELFDGPVTLKCGHCFCSLCIRQSLSEKQECPSCREADVNEGHLRVNPLMEEAVTAWKESRPFILQLLAKDERREKASARPSKRRRLNGDVDNPDTECQSCPSSTSSVSAKSKDDSRARAEAFESSDIEEIEPEDMIKCPSCAKRVRLKDINSHLDRSCEDEPQPERQSSKSQWANILGGKSKVGKRSNSKKGKDRARSEEEEDSPLPKKSYGTLKDKAIKELLQQHDLPTVGDRNTIIARHERWVIIYNANLDKMPKLRRNLDFLRRDLRQWEAQQKSKTKHDVLDSAVYQKKQKSEFDKLVEAARPKRPTSTPPAAPDRIPTSRTSSEDDAIVVDSEEETLDS